MHLQSTGTIGEDFCGVEDEAFLGFNHPIDGRMPVSSQSIKTTTGYRVTAIETEVINDDTVAFLGTSKGDLKKVKLQFQILNVLSIKGLSFVPMFHERGRYQNMFVI